MSQVSVSGSAVSGTVTASQGDSSNIVFREYPPTTMVFGNDFSLSWKDGVLVYGGNDMDESAKAFFEFLKPYVDNYIRSVIPYDNLKYLEWCANEGKNVK